MNIAMYLTAALFALAVLWKLYQLYRAPHDRPLRAVTVCVLCTAGSFSLGLRAEADAVNGVTGVGTSSLISNVLLLCSVYWLLAFYLHSANDRQKASRRTRLEAIPLAVALVVVSFATITTPADVRGRPYGTADLHTPQVAAFFIAGQLYLVYAMATTAWWTSRYARISAKPATAGLWLTAASLAGMAVANAFRVATDLISWCGESAPAELGRAATSLLAFAVPAFVVGVSYPGVAMRIIGFRIWRQHRQTYQRLRPLWLLLHDAFPQDALHRAPSGRRREFLRVRGVHRGYYRRVIECRDGLVRISPYLAQQGVQDGTTPETLAGPLQTALRAQAAGSPTTTRALAVALPVEDSLDADARQLVTLSDALRAPGKERIP